MSDAGVITVEGMVGSSSALYHSPVPHIFFVTRAASFSAAGVHTPLCLFPSAMASSTAALLLGDGTTCHLAQSFGLFLHLVIADPSLFVVSPRAHRSVVIHTPHLLCGPWPCLDGVPLPVVVWTGFPCPWL